MQKRHFLIIIAVLAFLVYVLWWQGCFYRPEPIVNETDSLVSEPKYAFGIRVDTVMVVKNKVRPNESLSDILLRYNVDYPKIDLLARRSQYLFDLRKIRQGNDYTVILTDDKKKKLLYFIYEISPVDYVVYDLGDSIHAHRDKKEMTVKVDTVSGIITSSLWNAIVENGTDPNLANELSEIYAWTIDFFGIQKGDHYKVVYENLFVEGHAIGLGKVLAVNFNHYGENHYAFYYMQDDAGDYFDEQANSLRRAFLKAPLKFKRISSNFSHSRMHPILKIRRPHLGVDYAADRGTPVVSIGDGTVLYAKFSDGGGRAVKIRHNGTYSTAYLHLSKYGPGIKGGARVKQGQVIGYVGSSGLSTGPHLDFRFYRNDKPVDPLKVESPPAMPVAAKYRQHFFASKDQWMKILQKNSIIPPDSLLFRVQK
jgi:murein DD-endopeptidase MepM/ murein hydrolase activator NlpD